MVKITEGSFDIDGASLYTKTWLPDGPPKAKMIMFHGFNDHIDRYYGFFPYLAERGIAVHGLDQRGWGRSARTSAEQGKTGPTTRVLADMEAFIRSHLPSDVPIFVLGHSMGGGQVLTLASTPSHEPLIPQIRGWILESPFLGFAPTLQPSALTIQAGRLFSYLLPNFKLHRPIPVEDISQDPSVQESLASDALLHAYGTLQGLAGLLDRTDALASGRLLPSRHVKSLFLAHGDADRSTCFHKSRAWFDGFAGIIPDRTFKAYDGFAHQLHADPGKEVFYEDVAAWILERSGTAGNEEEGNKVGREMANL